MIRQIRGGTGSWGRQLEGGDANVRQTRVFQVLPVFLLPTVNPCTSPCVFSFQAASLLPADACSVIQVCVGVPSDTDQLFLRQSFGKFKFEFVPALPPPFLNQPKLGLLLFTPLGGVGLQGGATALVCSLDPQVMIRC